MRRKKLLTPLTWPVLSFAVVIFLGSVFLCLPFAVNEGHSLSYVDALFLSTSAVCVTGLAPVDIGTVLSRPGLSILLALIQLGGLGITTYTSLVFILWRNRVPFADRLAVTQALLNKDVFDLRSFVLQVVGLVAAFEATAALLLYLHDPVLFFPFSAAFHAISAFCNAGFSLFPDNLMSLRDDVPVNLIIGTSIVCGGLGFAVLRELLAVGFALVRRFVSASTLGLHASLGAARLRRPFSTASAGQGRGEPQRRSTEAAEAEDDESKDVALMRAARYHHENLKSAYKVDRYSRIVIYTSLGLIFWGGVLIFFMENPRATAASSTGEGVSLLIASMFQSVSARTAGFNSVDLATLTDASLLVLVGLMFIGGSPGSCAGGIKTTTFRVLVSFFCAQLSGERSVVVRERAVTNDVLRQSLTLFFFGALTVCVSVVLLTMTENGLDADGVNAPTPLLALLFETVSALGTVGLSMNLTPKLTDPGKIIIILNMFIGRVGYMALLTALQSLRPSRPYDYPAAGLPIG